MNGPYTFDAPWYSSTPSPEAWETGKLIRGMRYQVAKPFTDSDGDIHPAGEEWSFVGAAFSRFENQITLSIKKDTDEGWIIPLTWTEDTQQDVIQNSQDYFAQV